MEKNEDRRSKWGVPVLALVLGGAGFVAAWAGGDPAFGAWVDARFAPEDGGASPVRRDGFGALA